MLRPNDEGRVGMTHSVAAYHDMTADELRAERDKWREQVCCLAREYRNARQSGDFSWEAGIGVSLDQALNQVRRLNALLKLGAVS